MAPVRVTSADDWRARVGDIWAAEWRRTDRSLADLSRHLDAAILAAAPSEMGAVLDIGSGAGATSVAIAAARPDWCLTGIDLSRPLVAIAQGRVPTATFHVGDAATEAVGQGRFDLLVSRHGVMFFADPVAAFARLYDAAAPGARLVFSCFRDRAHNVLGGALVAALGGGCPSALAESGPFAFADRDRVAAILAAAGWREATATATDFAYVAGEGPDPIEDAMSFLSRIGPVASLVAADPRAMRPRLADAIARYVTATRVVLPASAWIWRATKGVS